MHHGAVGGIDDEAASIRLGVIMKQGRQQIEAQIVSAFHANSTSGQGVISSVRATSADPASILPVIHPAACSPLPIGKSTDAFLPTEFKPPLRL